MVQKISIVLASKDFKQREEPSINGVLGGYGHIHDDDIHDSCKLI